MERQIRQALSSREAMTEFLRQLEPFIYRVCFHLTRHREDAEDLGQEALMKVCRHLHTYRGDCEFQTWVYRIILNTHRNLIRRRKNLQFVELQDTSAQADTFEKSVSMKMAVQEMLTEVDGLDREIFVLRFEKDMAIAEVADVLDMKVPTVKTRLLRLRDKLKSKWQQMGGWSE